MALTSGALGSYTITVALLSAIANQMTKPKGKADVVVLPTVGNSIALALSGKGVSTYLDANLAARKKEAGVCPPMLY